MAKVSRIENNLRPDIEGEPKDIAQIGKIMRPVDLFSTLFQITLVHRIFVLIIMALAWKAYTHYSDNPLMFASFIQTVEAFWQDIVSGQLPQAAMTFLHVLVFGYFAAIFIAALITALAVSTRIGTDFLSTLSAMFNPLTAIAVLPLALLWFGLVFGSVLEK